MAKTISVICLFLVILWVIVLFRPKPRIIEPIRPKNWDKIPSLHKGYSSGGGIGVWDRVLTQEEIDFLYEQGK